MAKLKPIGEVARLRARVLLALFCYALSIISGLGSGLALEHGSLGTAVLLVIACLGFMVTADAVRGRIR